MKSGSKLFTLLFSLFTLLVACSSIDCPVQNSVNTVWMVYDDEQEADTLRDTLTIYTTRHDGADTVLVNRDVNVDSLKLPISYTDPEDTLYFDIRGRRMTEDSIYYYIATIDTVYLAKENTPHFESVDCAISYFHTLTEVRYTTNRISSITINKASVNYDASTPNLYIVFK